VDAIKRSTPSGRILIILGGKDKGSDYTLLQKPLGKRRFSRFNRRGGRKIEKQISGSVALKVKRWNAPWIAASARRTERRR
jgi:hypothetical protein